MVLPASNVSFSPVRWPIGDSPTRLHGHERVVRCDGQCCSPEMEWVTFAPLYIVLSTRPDVKQHVNKSISACRASTSSLRKVARPNSRFSRSVATMVECEWRNEKESRGSRWGYIQDPEHGRMRLLPALSAQSPPCKKFAASDPRSKTGGGQKCTGREERIHPRDQPNRAESTSTSTCLRQR